MININYMFPFIKLMHQWDWLSYVIFRRENLKISNPLENPVIIKIKKNVFEKVGGAESFIITSGGAPLLFSRCP